MPKKILAILLLPFSVLYGIGVSLYQALYFSGLHKPVKFSFPVISVGNLSVGGTGKSPHIEYLIRLLRDYVELAVLSRGYKRKTNGFLHVGEESTALEVGDEPLQIKHKFPSIPVAVSESRSLGIPQLLKDYPDLQLILLDDAFQHLAVKPALSILLTEYSNPYHKDVLMPSGRLREWRFGAERADVIVVTKCPEGMGESEFAKWKQQLNLRTHQHLYFSKIIYGVPYEIFNPQKQYKLNPSVHVILISAIAQSGYLEDYLNGLVGAVSNYSFEDHHYFTEVELNALIGKYEAVSQSNKMILTTEKDATRLKLFKAYFEKRGVEVYAIPIEVVFYQQSNFDQYLKTFLLDFKV